MGSFNPFHKLHQWESARHLHAATHRTSFMQKLYDTFTVLAGSFIGEKEENRHVGLLDYATFFIPWLILYLADILLKWNSNKKSSLLLQFLSIFYVIPMAITMIVHPLRWLVAAALVLVSLPFVAMVHVISTVFTQPLREIIDAIPVIINNNCKGIDRLSLEHHSLKGVLDSYGLALTDLHAELDENHFIDKYESDIQHLDNEYVFNLYCPYTHAFDDSPIGSIALKRSNQAYLSLQFFNVGGIALIEDTLKRTEEYERK